MDQIKLTEKKLELALEKLIQQLLIDLNTIEDRNRIDDSNFNYMAEVFNSLAKAEYHIVHALTWSKGVNPQKYVNVTHNLFDVISKALKGTK